jgi:hypothetical protein
VAHFPPAAPGSAPGPVPAAARRPWRTWLALLLGAGAAALLAGLGWRLATAAGPPPGPPAASTASPAQADLQARYQATGIRVTVRPHRAGVRVRWGPPTRTAGVVAFVVVAELGGRAQQEHTVGPAGHSAVFAGLRAGRRYCFVVGTVLRPPSGQAATATAPPVCRVIR